MATLPGRAPRDQGPYGVLWNVRSGTWRRDERSGKQSESPSTHLRAHASSMAAIAYARGERAEPFSEVDWSDETNRTKKSGMEMDGTFRALSPSPCLRIFAMSFIQ